MESAQKTCENCGEYVRKKIGEVHETVWYLENGDVMVVEWDFDLIYPLVNLYTTIWFKTHHV